MSADLSVLADAPCPPQCSLAVMPPGTIACGFRRWRTGIPIEAGQSLRSKADSIPMIADSGSRRRVHEVRVTSGPAHDETRSASASGSPARTPVRYRPGRRVKRRKARITAFSSMLITVERVPFGPVGPSPGNRRFFHAGNVFRFTPDCSASALRLSGRWCRAQRTASVVVALR